jgi:subtilisin family serine protease
VTSIRSQPKNAIQPGQLLVKLRPSDALWAANERRLPIAEALAPRTFLPAMEYVSRIGPSGWTLWRVPEKADIRLLVERLKGQEGVLAAQPVNRIYPLLSTPNDPDFNAIESSIDYIIDFSDDPYTFRRLWHLDEIFAFDAWSDWPNTWYTAANKPTNGPLVAIIDTGCDIDHPDFRNAGGAGTDISQGGQFNKAKSVQFLLGDVIGPATTDTQGHGTHVTGLALAAGNNGGYRGHGVIGTGYNATGMILRVFDDQGVGFDTDAAAAIFYAVDNGADIINLSLGTTNYSQLFQDAVTYAFQKGALVICAGNENGSGGGNLGPIYPAACSGALAVTASGPDYSSATAVYTGIGPYLDVAAPGGSIITLAGGDFGIAGQAIQFVYSTATRTPCQLSLLSDLGILYPPYTLDYTYLAGTSMACPVVSGAAALYYGKFNLDLNDGWSNMRAYRAIEKSANGTGPLGSWEYTFGYGILDMQGLLVESDNRLSTVGGAEGIVYYNGTPVANVAVRARKVTGGALFSTTTRADGCYRFEAMPPGVYNVTAVPFGASKTKRARVLAGSDQTAVDFWCGTYTGDETAPEVKRFSATTTTNSATVTHWGYDTETGLDSIVFRIGTTTGAADVLADTIVVPDTNTVSLTGLTLTPGKPYYLRGIYKNGAGMTTTVDTQINASGPQISGTATLESWIGGEVTAVAELRMPGTKIVLESHTIVIKSNGTFSFRAGAAGTYDLTLKTPMSLRRKKASVTVPSGGLTGQNFALLNGDVDGNNTVTLTDYSVLSRAYGTRPGDFRWDARADLNGDLLVDMTDYALVRANYRKEGDQ